jgi:hypothetical protein
MIHFDSVMSRIKELLSSKIQDRVKDKDIAMALQLTPSYYAVIKRRKKVPYEAIALFCKEEKVTINWVLLDQKPVYLREV